MLNFLGRGGAFNFKEGNTSAYVKEGNKLFLLDCGETTFADIGELGLLDDIEDIHVIITHTHADHVGSLSTLIFYCHYILQISLQIYYCSKNQRNTLSQILNLMGCSEDKFSFHKLSELVGIFKTFQKITCYETPHTETVESYGFVFETEQGSIVYSGDTNDVNKIKVYALSDNVCKLYVETTLLDYDGNVHISLKKLCAAIPTEMRRKIYCMHVNNNECIKEAIKQGFNVVEITNNIIDTK